MRVQRLFFAPESGRGGEPGRSSKRPRASDMRDLADFSIHWGELRDGLVVQLQTDSLDAEARETLGWLILLADRVCPLETDQEPD